MIAICDTREQCPYTLPDAVVKKLDVGDYSLCGGEHLISIERKSLPDLVSSLSKGRERLERELFRGKAYDYFCLVIECNLEDIVEHRYRSEMSPASVIQSLLAFSVRYRMPVFFCGCREYAERVTGSLLDKFYREQQKRLGALEGGE